MGGDSFYEQSFPIYSCDVTIYQKYIFDDQNIFGHSSRLAALKTLGIS